jgi:exodeoxyribonuclease VII small subunit
MPFEAARTELDEIVGRLEDGGTTLEEALVLWERGEALHRRCAALLEGAEERLRVLRPVDPGD